MSPTRAEHVRADLGSDVDLVLDGGPARVGVESTIVDLSGEAPVLLRPGGVGPEELARVLGRSPARRRRLDGPGAGPAPSHYAPRAGVLLVEPAAVLRRALALAEGGARVAVAVPEGLEVPAPLTALRIPGDIEGLARELYALLRSLDASAASTWRWSPSPARRGWGWQWWTGCGEQRRRGRNGEARHRRVVLPLASRGAGATEG